MPQLALFSSFLFSRFGTPVYTQLGYYNTLFSPPRWDTYPAALERVIYRPFCLNNANAYHGETLKDVCNFADPAIWRVDQLTSRQHGDSRCLWQQLPPAVRQSRRLRLDSAWRLVGASLHLVGRPLFHRR